VKPKIITLCGSTKFKKQFEETAMSLTLNGIIVLSLGVFQKSDNIQITDDQIKILEKLHFHKIDISDEILVINDVNGYIGEGTKREIEYANKKGKKISYLFNQIQ
jgi:hypothetical protein